MNVALEKAIKQSYWALKISFVIYFITLAALWVIAIQLFPIEILKNMEFPFTWLPLTTVTILMIAIPLFIALSLMIAPRIGVYLNFLFFFCLFAVSFLKGLYLFAKIDYPTNITALAKFHMIIYWLVWYSFFWVLLPLCLMLIFLSKGHNKIRKGILSSIDINHLFTSASIFRIALGILFLLIGITASLFYPIGLLPGLIQLIIAFNCFFHKYAGALFAFFPLFFIQFLFLLFYFDPFIIGSFLATMLFICFLPNLLSIGCYVLIRLYGIENTIKSSKENV